MTTGKNTSERDAQIAEFRALRAEAVHYLGERRQLLWLSVIICIGLFSVAEYTKSGVVASLPMFVIFGCMVMSLVGFNATQRIGAYINVYIERRCPGFHWEHGLRDAYKDSRWKRRLFFGNRSYVIFGYMLVFTSLAIGSCVLTHRYGPASYAWPASIIGMAFVIFGDFLLVYLPLFRFPTNWATQFEKAYKALSDGDSNGTAAHKQSGLGASRSQELDSDGASERTNDH